jgi:hypothetical protein
LEIVALRPSWREIFLWKTEDRQKKEKMCELKSLANQARLVPQFSGNMEFLEGKRKRTRIAMRTVEFNQAMSGREGAQFAAPSPRAP